MTKLNMFIIWYLAILINIILNGTNHYLLFLEDKIRILKLNFYVEKWIY